MSHRPALAHWFELGWDAWLLGFEASSVIASRVSKLAGGGAAASREYDLMLREKVTACAELQARLIALGPELTLAAASGTALRHYRRKVRANRRRLRC